MSFAVIGLQVRNSPRKSVLNHISLSENIKIKYTFLATFFYLVLLFRVISIRTIFIPAPLSNSWSSSAIFSFSLISL